jgi:membrane protein implicated in regulation of membrane protease activity
MIENMLAFKELILRRKYGKFGTLILPAHLLMLIVLPWFFLLFVGGTLLLLLFNPLNYYLIGFVIFAFLAIVGSRKIQAVVKVQISLVLATAKMLKGIETQKFERLSSARS